MPKHASPKPGRRALIQQNAAARKRRRIAERADARFFSPKGLARLILSLVIVAFTADGIFSQTLIITPQNPALIWALRITGFVIGACLMPAYKRSPSTDWSEWGSKFFFICIPLIGAWLGEYGTWRIYNHTAFAFSNTPCQTAFYPVQSMSYSGWSRRDRSFLGRGSRHKVLIDPYDAGWDTGLKMPGWQYEQFEGDQSALCVAVQQRTSPGGAIQIKADFNPFTGASEPLDIRRCGEDMAGVR